MSNPFKPLIFSSCIIIALIFTGCAPGIPLKSGYFQTKSRLGLLVVTKLESKNGAYGVGPGGAIISSAFIPEKKYLPALNAIASKVNPDLKIKQFYMNIFSQKGKTPVLLDVSLYDGSIKDFSDINTPNDGRKYFGKDIRFFKNKYQLDEVLVVTVSCGIHSNYAYGIQTSQHCYTEIKPEMVNLQDNAFIYRDKTASVIPMQGEAEFNEYSELINLIIKTTNQAIDLQKEKYKAF